MQKLAGMPISEMALPEMARTAGTGGAYTITEKGEEILKQTKAAGKAPEGIKNSEIAALVFLFKAKKDGKRVQKIDYATERNVPQPAVNPIFNSLEAKELVAREGYTSKQQEPKTSRPRPDLGAVLGDLDIEEAQSNSSSPVKNYILSKFKYNDEDFDQNYNADSGLDDLMREGEYVEEAYFSPTSEEQQMIDKLIAQSGNSQDQEFFIKKYPFTDNPALGIEWTETLHVDEDGSNIYVKRSIPFNEDVKKYFETL
jgi:hypothetical protein